MLFSNVEPPIVLKYRNNENFCVISDELARLIERKRTQISKLESQLSKLSGRVHELSLEKVNECRLS